MRGILVEFKPFQIRWLEEMAAARNNCKPPEISQKTDETLSPIDANFVGLMGELAVAQVTGGKMDSSISISGDNGIDVVANGHGIAVHTNKRRYRDCHFVRKNAEGVRCEFGILAARVDEQSVEVIAWFTLRRWRSEHGLRDYGYGPAAFLSESKMSSMARLVEAFKRERARR